MEEVGAHGRPVTRPSFAMALDARLDLVEWVHRYARSFRKARHLRFLRISPRRAGTIWTLVHRSCTNRNAKRLAVMPRQSAESTVTGSRSAVTRRSDRFLTGLAEFRRVTFVSHV